MAKEPEEIIVKDVLVALEGDLKIVDNNTDNPILNMFFSEAKDSTKKIFDINLTQLDEYQDKYNEVLHYSI